MRLLKCLDSLVSGQIISSSKRELFPRGFFFFFTFMENIAEKEHDTEKIYLRSF